MSQVIALPDNLAQNMNAKRQAQAVLQNLRIQLAGEVFGQLTAVSYQAGLATGFHEKHRERELYGNGGASGDGDQDGQEDSGIPFGIDLLTPATTAVRAADMLMLMLGLIDPGMVKQGIASQEQMLAVLRGQAAPAESS